MSCNIQYNRTVYKVLTYMYCIDSNNVGMNQ